MPTIRDDIRDKVKRLHDDCGIEAVIAQLELLDPAYLAIVDRANHKRLLHALEICYQSGQPYSSLRTGQRKPRPFRIIKIGIEMPRQELFDRINRRVDKMIEYGLEQEARAVYPLKHLNSLNTVGFKEMFAYFDGLMGLHHCRREDKEKHSCLCQAASTLVCQRQRNDMARARPPYSRQCEIVDCGSPRRQISPFKGLIHLFPKRIFRIMPVRRPHLHFAHVGRRWHHAALDC